jgi:hypothetical protein
MSRPRRFALREAALSFLLVWSALFYLEVVIRSDQARLLMTLPPFFLVTVFGWSIVRETIVNYPKIDTILSTVFATVVASFLWILKPVALPDVSHPRFLNTSRQVYSHRRWRGLAIYVRRETD